MEVKTSAHLNYLTNEEQLCCPFLGVKNGLYAHVGYACNSNFCHRVIPAETIGLSHQERFCLTENYTGCQVYREPAQSQSLRDASPGELHIQEQGEPASLRNVTVSVDEWSEDTRKTKHRKQLVLFVTIVLIVLVMGGISAFVIINKNQQAEYHAALISQKTQLATAVYDAVLANYATATAALTEIPVVVSASTESQVQQPSLPTEPVKPTPSQPEATPTSVPPTEVNNIPLVQDVCEISDGYGFEVISGPSLTPGPGYRYMIGRTPPTIRATWVIRNTSQCSFDQLAIYSPFNAKTYDPVFIRDGDSLHPEEFSDKPVLSPGDVIEIGLEFSPQHARNIRDEWILIVNNLPLVEQPHLSLSVENWVILYAAEVNPTKVPKPRKESNKGNNNPPSSTEPPASPTERVPGR